MNKDQTSGAAQNVKGRVKQAAGVLSGNSDKESQGASERATGAARKVVGDLKHKLAKKIDR
ncbi:MAG TPA: CsbD family protein [Polyangia bacterium]|jgi:uncharacterized protein YjbJ (UPF0337 family)